MQNNHELNCDKLKNKFIFNSFYIMCSSELHIKIVKINVFSYFNYLSFLTLSSLLSGRGKREEPK